MQNFAELHLKPETLARYGLPDIPYPIPAADLKSALLDNGDIPLAAMLHGLQQRSRDEEAEWQQLEPAMDRLAELLAPDDARDVISAAGDHWWIEVGPVGLGGKLVTIQRGDALIAAITARDDGRLRVAVFRPLDAKSAEYLIGLGQVPHPEHGVCMRENNWEYALDYSAGNGNYYAADRGEAYLSWWEKGLGISWDGSDVPEWRKQLDLFARPVARAVAELGVYYTLSGNEDEEPVADAGAAERSETPAPPAWRSKRQLKRTVQGRFLGCLLGGAVGDALGAPVEFMKRTEILRRFGPKGITQYAPAYGGLGTITDDTQMSMFTAEGLLRAYACSALTGSADVPSVVGHAYLRWLHTQRESAAIVPALDGWLVREKALFASRVPGATVIDALRARTSFGERPRNTSKGCGGAMRVAPVGLWCARLDEGMSPERIAKHAFELGADTAALTHGHPTGQLAAGFVIFASDLPDVESVREALAAAAAGRLVLAVVNTLTATDTIGSLVDRFEPHQQTSMRQTLGRVLRGVVCQRLVDRADGRGRVAMVESLVGTPKVRAAIAANADPAVLERLMTEGDYHGMATFDQALFQLFSDEYVTLDEAMARVTNPEDFRILVQQSGLSSVH